VDHIAFNQDSRTNLMRKIRYFLTERPNINLVLRRMRNRRARAALPVLLEQAFPGQTVRGEIHGVEHHLAHLASAFHGYGTGSGAPILCRLRKSGEATQQEKS
jgi:carbamoyltransferase